VTGDGVAEERVIRFHRGYYVVILASFLNSSLINSNCLGRSDEVATVGYRFWLRS